MFATKLGIKGRMLVDPSKFGSFPGVEVLPDQRFLVEGHAHLYFVESSPLRHVGLVRFFECQNQQEVIAEVEKAWVGLLRRTEYGSALARKYFPELRLRVDMWMPEVEMHDDAGSFKIWVYPQGRFVRLVEVGGVELEGELKTSKYQLALPETERAMPVSDFRALLSRARADLEQRPAAELPEDAKIVVRSSTGSIDLGPLDTGPLELVPVTPSTPAVEASALDPIRPVARIALKQREQTPEPNSLSMDLRLTGDIPPDRERDDTPEQAVAVEEEPLKEPNRPERVRTSLTAELTTPAGRLKVQVLDVNLGGAFVSIPSEYDLPPIGAPVRLSHFGPFSLLGRVAHQRSHEEGELFGTPSGVGIAFSAERPNLAEVQDLPLVLALTSGSRRENVATACASFGTIALPCDNLIAAIACFYYFTPHLVVFDDTYNDGDTRGAIAALQLTTHGVAHALITSRPALPEMPCQTIAPGEVIERMTQALQSILAASDA